MGKSQKPLRIATVGLQWDEFKALSEQGHEVTTFDTYGGFIGNMAAFDLILGPTCWLMDEAHRKYLPLALAEARKRRYPKESREQSE